MCLDVEDPAKQCYEWPKSNRNVRSWTMELKEELYNMGLASVLRKQQECNLREITQIVKDRCQVLKDRRNQRKAH
jgi:hypothetical protein